MSQKWNLQDIRPNGAARKPIRERAQAQQDITSKSQPIRQELPLDPDLASIDIIDGNSARKKRIVITTIALMIIIGVGYAINTSLGGATVTVYPNAKNVSLQADFSAYTSQQNKEDLHYELLSLEATGEKQVKASGKETVSTGATGKIFVYNTKSSAPQRLIKNTRFESAEGFIFRIRESIEVPGATTDAKGNVVPGKIAADVFADGAGEQYNIDPQRFTVPGLKGSEQYDTVYGESLTSFTGGFEGDKYIIDPTELDTAQQALHIELRDTLLTQLNEKIPAGFTVYTSAATFTFDSLPATEYGDSLATLKEVGHLRIPIFKDSEFATYLAKQTIPDYNGDPVYIVDPATISFAYTSATATVSNISENTELKFTLTGPAQIVWQFDQNTLLESLLGIKKNDATSVFSTYTSISHAQADVRPFWTNAFPSSKDRIKVETVVEPK